jgi:hypothetical protein
MSRARDMASKTFWLPGETIQTVTMENITQGSQSLTGYTTSDIANMSLVITPKKSNSKILIQIRWSGEFNPQDLTWNSTFGCTRNGTQIGRVASAPAGSGIGIPYISYYGADANSTSEGCIYFVVDTPGITSAITYKATIANSISGTMWSNRTAGNAGTWDYESGTSAMIATEIAQ